MVSDDTRKPSTSETPESLSERLDFIDTARGRILCVADIRGKISQLNALAEEHRAKAIIHTGDFGFYEQSSLARIADKTLRHVIQYSNCISSPLRAQLLANNVAPSEQRQLLSSGDSQDPNKTHLSEFPLLLTGELVLKVPVYTVYGACEDVAVIEKIKAAPSAPISAAPVSTPKMAHPPSYSIPNLTILSESTTRVLDIGGLKLRLLGLGGAVISHKLFDNGEGPGTTAGAAGTMWTTILQIGELVDTAQRVYSQSETRLFISHASPGKEGLLAQLALVLRADFTVSASLHFRYGTSYNEFSVQQDQDAFRRKLLQSKDAFNEVWGRVRADVEAQIDDEQKPLLENALAVTNRVPQEPVPPGSASPDDFAYKNVWHFNLPDTTYGNLIFDLADGRVSTEMKSQGFHYLYRQNPPAPSTARPSLPSKGPSGPSPQATRAPSLAPSNEPSRSPAHRPQQHRDDHPHGRANGFNRNDRFSGNWNNSHSSNNERGPYNQPSGPMHRVGPKPADAPIKPPAVGPVATDSAAQRENSERPGSATGGRKTPNSNKPGKRPQGDRPERAQSEKPPASDVPAAATPTGETVPESSRPSRGGGRGHSRGGSAGGSRGGPTRGRGGNRPNEPREPREPRPPRENKPDAAKPQPGAASAPKAEAGDAKAASAKPAADANGA